MPTVQDNIAAPLVSVVIPCYNHGAFLCKAIESVQRQTYRNIEILVIDDGSTDSTKAVATGYKGVRYLYQHNRGLSAARNTGIRNSTGAYILFLDADDWLYPQGIAHQVAYLEQHRLHAFVSGGFDEVFVDENRVQEVVQEVNENHYHRLLQGNYIGMVATVLFRRKALEEVLFDEGLKNCEDYDVFLKIARKHPVGHQTHKIAAYRYHNSNMSGNIPAMLQGVLHVLDNHRKELSAAEEERCSRDGRNVFINYYCRELYHKLRHKKTPINRQARQMLLKYKPTLYFKFLLTQLLLK
ncbi:glycosyltransferase family 2 protein [Pontibacter akesuensis]|uniref:Glycosyltransferase involved in cell wall bisynthesis n=1 Tax=Pontibacter akesuensis TaxID=388950 RepID=A0A1I7GIC4_9BACT|nr:glycosyltransferase family 2 protein [Pontibacter akesuensis]GHA56650.1 hypothetical protein GCM10007389_05350 [Pontibacter akesuensis]SFU48193.1 Glycosyltransferase involved in cell wall bisynthesis [Pontibacter akesuensis]